MTGNYSLRGSKIVVPGELHKLEFKVLKINPLSCSSCCCWTSFDWLISYWEFQFCSSPRFSRRTAGGMFHEVVCVATYTKAVLQATVSCIYIRFTAFSFRLLSFLHWLTVIGIQSLKSNYISPMNQTYIFTPSVFPILNL